MKNMNQRVMLTKKLLKEGLFRLLKEKPLEKITVSELCLEAGINRATFYKYYSVPRDVLVENGRDFTEKMNKATLHLRSPLDAERYLTEVCTYLLENVETVKVFIRCNSDENFASMIKEFNDEMILAKRDFKPLREVDEDSLRLISTFLGCGGYYLLRQWIMEDIPKTPNEIAKLICGILAKGQDI